MDNNGQFIEEELIIITKQTFDLLLKQEKPSDLIALYGFYYYTAKWQQTNQIKSSTGYTAKGLEWGVDKVKKNKKRLIELNLIEDVAKKDKNGVITGWYIKVKYVFFKEQSTQRKTPPVVETATNALNTNNLNALNTNNDEQSSSLPELNETKEKLSETADLTKQANNVITYFCNTYKANSGRNYLVSSRGKYIKNLKKTLKLVDEWTLKQLIDIYLTTDDKFWEQSEWSLDVLIMDNTINKLLRIYGK